MVKKRILIVEDDLLIAEDIKTYLEAMNYDVVATAIKASKAVSILENEKVDLVLVDIIIKGSIDGIGLAKIITNNFKLPFIYLTSHSDPVTVNRAIKTKPNGYIVKPFTKADLFTSLALIFNNANENTQSNAVEDELKLDNECLYFKIDGSYQKIRLNDVNYFKSAGNYIEIHKNKTSSLVRMTIKQLLKLLTTKQFIQTHKSYIINANNIEAFDSKIALINKEEIPVGRQFVNGLEEYLMA